MQRKCPALSVFVLCIYAACHPAFASLAVVPGQGTFRLEAPVLARTSSTVLLMWERPPGGNATEYEIFRDGALVGRTPRLSHTVTGLPAGEVRRFHVRAVGAALVESPVIEVATRPRGAVFDVKKFGAKGDGVAIDTEAVRRAIAACTRGGTVTFPPGVYRVGALVLKSDLTFEVPAGATLQFLGRQEFDYPHVPLRLPGPDGDVPFTSRALLSAVGAENIAIVGAGTINGNGPSWWPPDRSLQRPKLLKFVQCRNVLVQGVTLDDPPMWNTHLVYVDDAVLSGVTFRKVSPGPGTNGDGIDPNSARNVLIVGCTFQNQDDSIAIKSGHASASQPRRQRPCENIIVRDCRFEARDGARETPLGLAIGSEVSGGVRHVRVQDCEFRDVASIAYIKTNRARMFSWVEDVRIENCRYTNTRAKERPQTIRGPISIDLFYYAPQADRAAAEPTTRATPRFRDIHFKNITIENPVGRFIYVCGLPEQPVENLTFENVTGSARTGLQAQNVAGLALREVDVEVRTGKPVELIHVTLAAAAAPEPFGKSDQPRERTRD